MSLLQKKCFSTFFGLQHLYVLCMKIFGSTSTNYNLGRIYKFLISHIFHDINPANSDGNLYLNCHKKCEVIITIKYYLLSSPFATCDEFSWDSNWPALLANILRRDLPRNRSAQGSCQDRSQLGTKEVCLRDRHRIA